MRLRNQRAVTLSTSSQVLLGPNPRRKGVIISSDAAIDVTLSFNAPAVAGQGIVMHANNAPLQLVALEYEDALTNEIYAIAASGTPTIGVVEIFGP